MADTDSNNTGKPVDPAISRRDFLRRAGKEAAVTGTKLVPGAAIAQKVLGISPEPLRPDASEAGKPVAGGIVAKIAAWRRQRNEDDGSVSSK